MPQLLGSSEFISKEHSDGGEYHKLIRVPTASRRYLRGNIPSDDNGGRGNKRLFRHPCSASNNSNSLRYAFKGSAGTRNVAVAKLYHFHLSIMQVHISVPEYMRNVSAAS
jgi:hypothetical protein